MTPVADNSLRQAADFVRNLDPEAAAAMLGRLSASEATALRAAIAELDASASEASPQATVSDDGAVELQLGTTIDEPAVALTPNAAPEPPQSPQTPEPPPFDGAEWLSSLGEEDPRAIAAYLSQEQPRAVAAVLGYLSPALAAGVLQSLPADEQAGIVRRLAEQGEADPDSLRVIASGLADWLQRQRAEHERRTSRVATIRQILAATPEDQRRRLIDCLAVAEPEVASSLGETIPSRPEPATPEPTARPARPAAPQPTIPFEQLERVDGRALAEALGALDGRTALLALAAAPEALLKRLMNGLPRKAAADLRNRIHRVGPTTLAEIDGAQEAFARSTAAVVAKRRTARLAARGA